MQALSAAILVGGESRRMGYNKAFLKIGQSNLVESIVARLKTIFPDVFLIGNDPEPYRSLGLPVIADLYKGCGPLGGIHAALVAANTPYVFITACDVPFLDVQVVAHMAGKVSGYDVVVPKIRGYLEPLCAIYGKNCLPAIESQLKCGQCKVIALFSAVRVNYLEQEEIEKLTAVEKAFLNINTPKDMQKAISLTKFRDRDIKETY
jgi:molybdopterin-guanine dinucleotide biosynthesis protein A